MFFVIFANKSKINIFNLHSTASRSVTPSLFFTWNEGSNERVCKEQADKIV
jgi:hypothetical protein